MSDEAFDRVSMFSVESSCPTVDKPATLYEDTWNSHIKVRHPEVSPYLADIQLTVTSPDYAAKSLDGPEGKNSGNLVLVNNRSAIQTSVLHVFLAETISEWRVTSAMFSKSYHSEKVWDVTTGGVKSDYDAESDVLYLYKGEPQSALTEASGEGLLLRYAISDNTPCGVTVLSYKKSWQDYHDLLVQKVSEFLGVGKAAAERAVEGIS